MTASLFIHVPKTGGSTIKVAYRNCDPPLIAYGGHTSALQMREKDPVAFERMWKFAFVRNPWDHAVAWFFFGAHQDGHGRKMVAKDLSELRPMFNRWLEVSGPRCLGEMNRNFKSMLCGLRDENLVDAVFRFEQFDGAWASIREQLGLEPESPLHINVNPYACPYHYSYLYDTWSKGYIEGLQWWVIEQFRYRFED